MPKLMLMATGAVILLVVILSAAAFPRSSLNLFSAPERASPGDWIKEEQITVTKDKVILNIFNPIWAKFTDTNSMDPFIDQHAHAIEIKPSSAKEIQVGDVISYPTPMGIIIHRVIKIGYDEKGFYCLAQGDNNAVSDHNKIRFEEIIGVVVAVIY